MIQGTDALRERDILRNLEPHENIVKYYCHFPIEDDVVGLAMELCEGTVHDFHMARRLKFYEVSFLMGQTLRGLEHLHKNSTIHRFVEIFIIS